MLESLSDLLLVSHSSDSVHDSELQSTPELGFERARDHLTVNELSDFAENLVSGMLLDGFNERRILRCCRLITHSYFLGWSRSRRRFCLKWHCCLSLRSRLGAISDSFQLVAQDSLEVSAMHPQKTSDPLLAIKLVQLVLHSIGPECQRSGGLRSGISNSCWPSGVGPFLAAREEPLKVLSRSLTSHRSIGKLQESELKS